MAKVTPGKQISHFADIFDFIRDAENEDRLNRHRYYEMGDELFIWKMPQFDMEDAQIGDMMGKVKKRKALILDLRGNGGGLASTLQKLVGYFFDRDVKIADIKRRKETKPEIAKSRGDRIFTGQVIVLVDSESGSAAEMFARIIQLEKRGTVIGDRTAGAVMQSRYHNHESGVDIVAFYGVSVTEADVIMSDGKSLEHTGVTPDQLMLPTAAQMSAKQDPVLAHAASLVGVKIDAEKAGALFPVEWRK
jgi:C-terminal processing protease CtpA/Prc